MKNRILLISLTLVLVLSVSLIGCGGEQMQDYILTVSSTDGGEIASPEDAISSHQEGTEVSLVALPHTGYRFKNWTGDVSSIADVDAALTTIIMNGDYLITANFDEEEEELPMPLKIGVLQSLDWVPGYDGYHGMAVGANELNGEDGLDIGGTKYEIELILYDHHLDINQAKTGAESLIEDGCNYILGDCFIPAAINLTNDAGVVMIGTTYDASNLDPDYEWHWSGAAGSTVFPAAVPLLASITASGGTEDRTYQGVFPDAPDGWLSAVQHENWAESAGLIVLESIFYDPEATDLSSVGTQINSRDPDIVDSYGRPAVDAAVIAAAHDAGWTGQIFLCETAPAFLTMALAGPEAAEGAIGIGWPTEFGTTDMANEFIADWTAEYGEWTFPEIVVAQELWILITAMKKAGSIEPEDIKAVLDNGMTFESPCGPGQMIARPDLGNSRTVDCITWDLPIKQISGGEILMIDTVSETEMKEVVDAMYGGTNA